MNNLQEQAKKSLSEIDKKQEESTKKLEELNNILNSAELKIEIIKHFLSTANIMNPDVIDDTINNAEALHLKLKQLKGESQVLASNPGQSFDGNYYFEHSKLILNFLNNVKDLSSAVICIGNIELTKKEVTFEKDSIVRVVITDGLRKETLNKHMLKVTLKWTAESSQGDNATKEESYSLVFKE